MPKAIKPEKPPADARFLSIKEAAYILRVSVWHLYEVLKTDNHPPYFRVGNLIRFPRAKFQNWCKDEDN